MPDLFLLQCDGIKYKKSYSKMQGFKSSNRWVEKGDVVCIDSGMLLNHKKKKWNFAICSNMDGPEGYYAKWNKSE